MALTKVVNGRAFEMGLEEESEFIASRPVFDKDEPSEEEQSLENELKYGNLGVLLEAVSEVIAPLGSDKSASETKTALTDAVRKKAKGRRTEREAIAPKSPPLGKHPNNTEKEMKNG